MRELAFPDEPQRHDRSRGRGESLHDFYSRFDSDEVAAYRRKANTWLSSYPEQHQSEFLRRFRGTRDDDHNAAFFELFMHEYLRGIADRIEIECEIPGSGKRADFGLHFTDGGLLLVEALSIQGTRMVLNPNVNQVMEYVSELRSSEFTLTFGIAEGELTSTPRRDYVQKWARRAVERLDWCEAHARAEITGDSSTHIEPLQWDNWMIQASLYVKPSDRRIDESLLDGGPVKVGYDEVPCMVRERILKKIRGKTRTSSDMPFILAVNVNDRMLRDRENEREILYGIKDAPQFPTSPTDAVRAARSMELHPGTEGVWVASDGRTRYERCSAIWFFHQVDVIRPHGSRQALYLNPFVSHDFRTLALHHFATADVGLPD